MHKTPLTRDLLVQLYVAENLTAVEIAARTGYSRGRVFYYLEKFGIKPNKRTAVVKRSEVIVPLPIPDRPYSLERKGYDKIPGKKWLYQRYWEDNQNVTAIAKELGVNPNSVTKALHRHGIPIKPRYMVSYGKPHRNNDWQKGIRARIIERDHAVCQLCGTSDRLEVHHIVPLRLGGRSTVENGVTLCKECHDTVGFRETDWIGKLLEIRGTRTG